jgi:tetratricopeptide (TPR) repeat protein
MKDTLTENQQLLKKTLYLCIQPSKNEHNLFQCPVNECGEKARDRNKLFRHIVRQHYFTFQYLLNMPPWELSTHQMCNGENNSQNNENSSSSGQDATLNNEQITDQNCNHGQETHSSQTSQIKEGNELMSANIENIPKFVNKKQYNPTYLLKLIALKGISRFGDNECSNVIRNVSRELFASQCQSPSRKTISRAQAAYFETAKKVLMRHSQETKCVHRMLDESNDLLAICHVFLIPSKNYIDVTLQSLEQKRKKTKEEKKQQMFLQRCRNHNSYIPSTFLTSLRKLYRNQTAQNLQTVVLNEESDHNLNKIKFTVSDNCNAMLKYCRITSTTHIPCAAHGLNLIYLQFMNALDGKCEDKIASIGKKLRHEGNQLRHLTSCRRGLGANFRNHFIQWIECDQIMNEELQELSKKCKRIKKCPVLSATRFKSIGKVCVFVDEFYEELLDVIEHKLIDDSEGSNTKFEKILTDLKDDSTKFLIKCGARFFSDIIDVYFKKIRTNSCYVIEYMHGWMRRMKKEMKEFKIDDLSGESMQKLKSAKESSINELKKIFQIYFTKFGLQSSLGDPDSAYSSAQKLLLQTPENEDIPDYPNFLHQIQKGGTIFDITSQNRNQIIYWYIFTFSACPVTSEFVESVFSDLNKSEVLNRDPNTLSTLLFLWNNSPRTVIPMFQGQDIEHFQKKLNSKNSSTTSNQNEFLNTLTGIVKRKRAEKNISKGHTYPKLQLLFQICNAINQGEENNIEKIPISGTTPTTDNMKNLLGYFYQKGFIEQGSFYSLNTFKAIIEFCSNDHFVSGVKAFMKHVNQSIIQLFQDDLYFDELID